MALRPVTPMLPQLEILVNFFVGYYEAGVYVDSLRRSGEPLRVERVGGFASVPLRPRICLQNSSERVEICLQSSSERGRKFPCRGARKVRGQATRLHGRGE